MKDEITVADDLLFHTVEKLKQLDHANLTDEQERTRRELAIYKGYFDVLAGIVKNPHSDGKTETAREYVGQHIHPGYMAMSDAIALYTNDALNIPTPERLDLVRPIGELMLLIGTRWNDANNAALNVRACFDDVQDKIATLDNVQTMTHDAAARFMADIDTLRQTLRQRLIELSAVLMGAPASGVDSETLAAVQDVAHDVRAARADIAAVGADAHAGRVAAEHAARDANAACLDIDTIGVDIRRGADAINKLAIELDDWRKWIDLCGWEKGKSQTDQAQSDVPQMFVAVRDAIYQLWQKFSAEPADCEMRDGSLRKPGQKRTYAECVEQYGATVVYTSPATGRKYYLSEYCRNAQELEKAINAARMAEKRKHGAKTSPHKCRTHKRQK